MRINYWSYILERRNKLYIVCIMHVLSFENATATLNIVILKLAFAYLVLAVISETSPIGNVNCINIIVEWQVLSKMCSIEARTRLKVRSWTNGTAGPLLASAILVAAHRVTAPATNENMRKRSQHGVVLHSTHCDLLPKASLLCKSPWNHFERSIHWGSLLFARFHLSPWLITSRRSVRNAI